MVIESIYILKIRFQFFLQLFKTSRLYLAVTRHSNLLHPVYFDAVTFYQLIFKVY